MKLAAMVSDSHDKLWDSSIEKKGKKRKKIRVGVGLEPRERSARARALIQCTSLSHYVFMGQI